MTFSFSSDDLVRLIDLVRPIRMRDVSPLISTFHQPSGCASFNTIVSPTFKMGCGAAQDQCRTGHRGLGLSQHSNNGQKGTKTTRRRDNHTVGAVFTCMGSLSLSAQRPPHSILYTSLFTTKTTRPPSSSDKSTPTASNTPNEPLQDNSPDTTFNTASSRSHDHIMIQQYEPLGAAISQSVDDQNSPKNSHRMRN